MPHPDRRAEPGAVISTQDDLGQSYRFQADDDGIVKIRTADEDAVADRLQLPVARVVEKQDQGDKPTPKKEG